MLVGFHFDGTEQIDPHAPPSINARTVRSLRGSARAKLAEYGTDIAAAAFGSPVGFDDVESGRLEHRAQLTRGPAVGANDSMVEGLDLGAIEVAEQESAAGVKDSSELGEWDNDLRRFVMNRGEPGEDAAEGVAGLVDRVDAAELKLDGWVAGTRGIEELRNDVEALYVEAASAEMVGPVTGSASRVENAARYVTRPCVDELSVAGMYRVRGSESVGILAGTGGVSGFYIGHIKRVSTSLRERLGARFSSGVSGRSQTGHPMSFFTSGTPIPKLMRMQGSVILSVPIWT